MFETYCSEDILIGIPSYYGYLEGHLLILLIYDRHFLLNVKVGKYFVKECTQYSEFTNAKRG